MTRMILPWLFSLIMSMTGVLISQDISTDLKGRWDLVIDMDGEQSPSWLEVYKSGHSTLVGRFVFAFGSARPVSEVKVEGQRFSFSIPRQWEPEGMDMTFEGSVEGNGLSGTMRYTDGKKYTWSASRAPKLAYNNNPSWGAPVHLFNKEDMSGWHVRGESQWVVEDGLLKNTKSGGNLISDQLFTDFKLHVEFRYPEGSNSGIYLRGRYEVQIEDNKGMEPSNTLFAGVYGFLTPNEMVARSPGEWQEYDITLIGRRVTIVANCKPVIVSQNIPGITGGALDSREGAPGPIFIQGDHGPIEFRNIVVTPTTNN